METRAPRNAMEVYCVAKQWMWKFQHLDGQREINELHVPLGRACQLTMTSQDVIHSFFVPAFRVKAGRAARPLHHHLVSAHAGRDATTSSAPSTAARSTRRMIGEVVVMDPADYERWLGGGGQAVAGRAGQKLFSSSGRMPCCHRADTAGRGPNLAGLLRKHRDAERRPAP